MTTQRTLFDPAPEMDRNEIRLTSQTEIDRVSAMADKRSVKKLTTLANRIEACDDPIKRAALAAELRDLADNLVATSINDANANGLTWRQIGAELGVPFQTLYRRYGTR